MEFVVVGRIAVHGLPDRISHTGRQEDEADACRAGAYALDTNLFIS